MNQTTPQTPVPLHQKAIVEPKLKHTSRPDGDDSGYRDVAILPEEGGKPDPIVVVEDHGVKTYPVYGKGACPRITPYYGTGIGGPQVTLLRKPAVTALIEMNRILAPYEREVLVLDGLRFAETQRKLWEYLFQLAVKNAGMEIKNLSSSEVIKFGLQADNIGSYVSLKNTRRLKEEIESQIRVRYHELEKALTENKLGSIEEAASLLVTFLTNIAPEAAFEGISLDDTAITAHGGGGAIDMMLLNTKTGEIEPLGVPFDFLPDPKWAFNPGAMAAFEHHSPEEMAALYESSPELLAYLNEFGETHMTHSFFLRCLENRRMLLWAAKQVGMTHYNSECWHFNGGNTRGGNQANTLPGSGSGCQALLLNVRDHNGIITACWGSEIGQQLGRELLQERNLM